MAEAFFRRDGDEFVPGDAARGPWDRESLHGRVLSGLLGYAIEQRHGDPAFQIARLTVDMFRLAPHAPVAVETRPAREGNRIRVIDATMRVGDVEVARASAVLLRRTDQPEGTVWSPPDWDAPRPEDVPAPVREGRFGFDAGWDTRNVVGSMGGGPGGPGGPGAAPVQKRSWMRSTIDFVEGEATTPFVRAAAAADFSNPLANSGDRGLNFVNADATLYLHRLPVGEWIGFEVASHESAAGIAVGECTLYDVEGAIGRSAVCAVAQVRRG